MSAQIYKRDEYQKNKSVQKITIFCTLSFYVEISEYFIYSSVQKPNKKSMFIKDLEIKLWYTGYVYRRFVF